MTILADTPAHLVESESGLLTITRRSDGQHLAFSGRRVAGEFRDCLKTHAPDRVVATYERLAGGPAAWRPSLYKPGRVPPHGAPT